MPHRRRLPRGPRWLRAAQLTRSGARSSPPAKNERRKRPTGLVAGHLGVGSDQGQALQHPGPGRWGAVRLDSPADGAHPEMSPRRWGRPAHRRRNSRRGRSRGSLSSERTRPRKVQNTVDGAPYVRIVLLTQRLYKNRDPLGEICGHTRHDRGPGVGHQTQSFERIPSPPAPRPGRRRPHISLSSSRTGPNPRAPSFTTIQSTVPSTAR